MQIAKVGRVDFESMEKTVGEMISKENVLCSDSHLTIISWAKDKEVGHHTFLASKQHVKNKCFYVQHTNALDNLFERWVKRFYGVAAKYLSQYLNCFVFTKKLKHLTSPAIDLSKLIIGNTNAIKHLGTLT